MSGTRTLKVEIAGDSRGAQQAFRGIDDSATKSTGVLGKFKGATSLAFAGAGVAAGAFAVELFRTGTELELMGKKSATVFGDQLDEVQSWADKSAHAMGLTKSQATGLAASFADLLIPMGFTRDAAADMATKVVGLSGALSEWSNGKVTAAEASDILAKAMLGETDGLKSLGISISAADIQTRILAKGQQELTGVAREQAEAIATQELIFEKSTDAQNAFANGSDSAARKQAELRAKLEETKETLANGLQPAFQGFASFLSDTLIPAIESVGAEWGEASVAMEGFFARFIEHNKNTPIADFFGSVYEAFAGDVEARPPVPGSGRAEHHGRYLPEDPRFQEFLDPRGGGSGGPDTSGGRRIPRMHSGGVFTTPNPSGEGFAILRQGEVVSEGGGGVHHHYHFHGAVVGADAGQQLAALLDEYWRRGGRGGRAA